MEEEWRDIEGYEGIYQISNLGRVRSLSRIVARNRGGPKKQAGQILSITVRKGPYLGVTLSKNGRKKNFTIHRLLARHFIANPAGLAEVNHIDGNKFNNCLSNLEWVTHGGNSKHAYDLGLNKGPWGEKNFSSKLTALSVQAIRTLIACGVEQKFLASHYGVHNSTISAIHLRKKWRNL